MTALLGLTATAVLAQEAPERRKEVFETPEGVVELEYSVLDGQAVFEGDILLPSAPEPSHKGHRDGAVVATIGKRWPHGIIPYNGSTVFAGSVEEQAMQDWMRVTPIRFINDPYAAKRIRFIRDPAATAVCQSAVGMQGGEQIVFFSADCGLAATIHALGHVIGLWHEHNRPDRDSFVTMNLTCASDVKAVVPNPDLGSDPRRRLRPQLDHALSE